MLFKLIDESYINEVTFISILIAFAATCLIISLCKNILPRDQGRAFAVNGAKSEGKPRGAGIIFVLVFAASSIIFVPYSNELLIYILLVVGAMLSGYLDDRSNSPWGEYKKAIIDLALAICAAITYVNYNGTSVQLLYTDTGFTMPTAVFVILAVILIWVSINVTNCSDGVDGLCGSLSIISMVTIYGICKIKNVDSSIMHVILIFAVCLLGYLWFNASPSRLLMGDAGSRAIGFFLAVMILKTKSPLLFIPAALVLIIDGGLGLVKVSVMRFLKLKGFMKNIRTPIHDHMRKNKGWSDTQVVFRFSIVQLVISLALLFA